jgi:surface polysaccharide O-acyltransferase-like enzyme
MNKEFSDGLRICSLFATILVVSIHYNTKQFIDLHTGPGSNYYAQEIITNGIARTAVPYFSFASGMLFFLSFQVSKYPWILVKKFRTLTIPYLIGAAIIYVSEYAYLEFFKGKEFSISINSAIRDLLLAPLSIQYWFLRDLMFLILFSPIFWVAIKYIKSLLVIALLTLWYLDAEFMPLLADRHIITIETMTFFALGGWVALNIERFQTKIIEFTSLQLGLIFLLFSTSLVWRISIEPYYYDGYGNNYSLYSLLLQKTMILTGMPLLLGISVRIRSPLLVYLSGYSFFIFLYHSYPLARIIVKTSDFLIPDSVKFYVTFPLALLTSLFLGTILNRYMPALFKMLSGGRGPTNKSSRIP